MTSEELDVQRSETVRETQERTNAWLRERRFWFVGQTRPGLMKSLAEFRKQSSPKPAGKDWARILLSRIADGLQVPLVAETMAREALRLPDVVEIVE